MKQFVYVMSSAAGHIKVGVSAKPETRRAALQTGSGVPVELVKVFGPFNAATKVESAAHAALDTHRMEGEWFACTPQAAVAAVDAAVVSFCDEPDRDETRSNAELQKLAEWAASGIVRPACEAIDFAKTVMDRYTDLVDRYNKLADEFEEACELLDWYGEMAKDMTFLAREAMNQVIRHEQTIKALRESESSHA